MTTKRKRRGLISVLSRQKPKKARGKRSDWLRNIKIGAAIVVALSAFGIAYSIFSRSTKPAVPEFQWKVSLKIDGNAPLSPSAAEEILSVVRRNLGQGSKVELGRAARLAQQTEAYAIVHLLRTAKDTVVVNIKPREAVLCIEADKLRLIAGDGAVYGSALSPEACPGPVLRGVFSEGRTRYVLNDDVTLRLDEEEQAVIREALDLVRLATSQKMGIASLDHHRYRGFNIMLKDRELEVAIGRAPFAGKLHKLDEILNKLAEKGEQAMRVELDYQGKAFIKLKKM